MAGRTSQAQHVHAAHAGKALASMQLERDPFATVFIVTSRTAFDGIQHIARNGAAHQLGKVSEHIHQRELRCGGYFASRAARRPMPSSPRSAGGGRAGRAAAQLESPITVSGRSGNVPADTAVQVAIVHRYQGDLKVDLVGPDGSVYVLHNRAGGSADNIARTYTVNLSTEAINGTWKLRVNDNASGDVGRIDSWSISLLQADTRCVSFGPGPHAGAFSAGMPKAPPSVPQGFLSMPFASNMPVWSKRG
jgi:hypothetical protein